MASEPGRRSDAVTVARTGARPGLAPIGSRRIEVTLSAMASVFGLLFAVATLPYLADDWSRQRPGVALALASAVYGVIALAALAALLRQWTRPVFWACGVVYLLALALWPASVTGAFRLDESPWLFALYGVPCVLVVVAARWQLALAYVVGVCSVIGFLRTTASSGGAPVAATVWEVAYHAFLGVAMLLVVHAVRRAARKVDRAQSAALHRYADAQIDEATESERVRTDALVHDSVLTTFLSAAGATTPEARQLASRMALHAMHVLSRATVASHVGPTVPVRDLVGLIRAESADVGLRFEFETRDVREHFVPDPVADAIVSAAVQAMTNSVKHAGGPDVPRTVTVLGTAAGGVRVLVEDRGHGFDPAKIASERLGLRVSIMERMRRAGGEVELTTAIGEGTSFALSWPAAEPTVPSRGVPDEEAVLA